MKEQPECAAIETYLKFFLQKAKRKVLLKFKDGQPFHFSVLFFRLCPSPQLVKDLDHLVARKINLIIFIFYFEYSFRVNLVVSPLVEVSIFSCLAIAQLF